MPTSHDKNKLQKLTNLDFSQPGHHMALVTRGANGEEVPLIVKSLDVLNKGDFFDGDDESNSGLRVDMSLEDALSIAFNAWGPEARLIANSIVKSLDKESAESVHSLLMGNLSQGTPSGAAAPAPLVAKSADTTNLDNNDGEQSMPDENKVEDQTNAEMISKSVVEDMLSKAIEESTAPLRAQIEKFEADEAERKQAHYSAQAVEFKELGATEEDAEVFKALGESKHGARVIEMLKSAKDVMSKEAHLESIGDDGEGSGDSAPSSMDELKSIAKKIEEDEGVTSQMALTLAATRNPHLAR